MKTLLLSLFVLWGFMGSRGEEKMGFWKMMKCNFLILFVVSFLVSACVLFEKRRLDSFKQNSPKQRCYDRKRESHTFIVDTHVHFRPFGGEAISFLELTEYFRRTGILFVNVSGVGQSLPIDSQCSHYLDCPGELARPGIKNDFINAASYVESRPEDVFFVLSMTFPDLANPGSISSTIALYDKEYPRLFRWMGEVNLNKQALLKNLHEPAKTKHIEDWKDFMRVLRERNIPLTIYSDLGTSEEPEKFMYLMEEVLKLYPDNKIIWAHMGLSIELKEMDAKRHIQIMEAFFKKYPNLMLDISWRILEDNHFSRNRDLYVSFLNNHSRRILPGTDFVASRDKSFKDYREELMVTSRINQYLGDEAFRNIALGANYFRLLGLNYQAPAVCKLTKEKH